MKQKNKDQVVIFIFLDKEKILIEKRVVPNHIGMQYLIPGGSVEKELETLEQAVKREVAEELGLTDLDISLLPTKVKIRGFDNQHLIPFIVNKWTGKLPTIILDQGNPIEWVDLDEVLKTPVRPTREIVQALKDHLTQ